jgi:hypothetical protein
MLDKPQWIVNAIKDVPSSFLVAVCVSLGIILFVPAGIAAMLGVDTFRQTFRVFLGPSFILVASWLIARFLGSLGNPFQRYIAERKVRKYLRELTPEEKGYLKPFIADGKNTIHTTAEDGISGGLAAKRIIYCPSREYDLVEGVPFNLNPSARRHLEKNPDLLKSAKGKPVTPMGKAKGPW